MRSTRQVIAGIAGIGLAAGLAVAPASATDIPAGSLGVPESITALGDSITAGVHVNRLLVTEPAYSWSTGTNSTVQSLYTRLEPLEAGAMTRTNLSKSGAKVADLPGQAAGVANNAGADVVTILIGANDACTSTVEGMTTPTAFRASLDSALATLGSKGVEQVAISSIPDINQLWAAGKGSSSARFTWGLYKICQSLLANPTSTQAADVQRRAAVRARVQEFNAQIKAACTAAAVPCRYDGGAVFNTPFVLSDISKADYFHPSPTGQAKLASTTYAAFGF